MQAKCEVQKAGVVIYSKNAQSWHFSTENRRLRVFLQVFSGVYFLVKICRVLFVGNHETDAKKLPCACKGVLGIGIGA